MTGLRYISECDGPVKTPDLATRFGVDPSTITKTIRELADAGFITLAPHHGASLSPAGRVYAGKRLTETTDRTGVTGFR